MRRRVGKIPVERPVRAEHLEHHLVAPVRLPLGLAPPTRVALSSNPVGLRIPLQLIGVDHRRRDLLVDDPLHDGRDQPLAGEPLVSSGVERPDLVAEAPVGDQPLILLESSRIALVDQAIHTDVVAVDVAVGGGAGPGQPLERLGRQTVLEAPGQPRPRPALAGPARPLAQPLFERGDRVVEQRDKGDLAAEQILGHMGRGAV